MSGYASTATAIDRHTINISNKMIIRLPDDNVCNAQSFGIFMKAKGAHFNAEIGVRFSLGLHSA